MAIKEIRAYKLLRLRKNGTLGSLFINRRRILTTGEWLTFKRLRPSGFAYRPGWHACLKKSAPHLSMTGRVWCRVLLRDVTKHHRPTAQGGVWFTAKYIKILEQC